MRNEIARVRRAKVWVRNYVLFFSGRVVDIQNLSSLIRLSILYKKSIYM